MRHVDDGTLHAWLDGQVTAAADTAWIAQHLRTCAPCAARLDEERAAIEQTEALLASVAPVADNSRMAFDALAARAASEGLGSIDVTPHASSRGRRGWLVPVAWAASLVFAVLAGWAARERVVRDAAPGDVLPAVRAAAPVRDIAVAPATRATSVTVAAAAPSATPAAPVERRTPPRQSPTISAQRNTSPPTFEAPALFGVGRGIGTVIPPPAQTEIVPARPGIEFGPPAPAPPAGQAAEMARVAAGEAGLGAGSRFGLASPGRGGAVPAAAAAAGWKTLARTEAAALTGMPLYGIDGLMPTATMVNADASIVRTLYRVAPLELIELLQQRSAQTRAAAREETVATAPTPAVDLQQAQDALTARSWSIERDGRRLTIRGGTDPAALGARLRLD